MFDIFGYNKYYKQTINLIKGKSHLIEKTSITKDIA